MTTIVGVSLKMYFSHARTLDYCAALADLATGSAPVVAGRTRLVVMPQYPSIPAALQTVAGSRVEVGAQDVIKDMNAQLSQLKAKEPKAILDGVQTNLQAVIDESAK